MSPIVALYSDFGAGSVYVGQMHAVLSSMVPGLRVLDMAHECPRAAVEAAAYVLGRCWFHCPPGTVHVVVVDPEVGGPRDVLAARSKDHLFVAPDNGVLGPVLEGAEVRRVENPALMRETISSTFHGRDIMAPVAAHLASGTPLEEVGAEVEPHRPDHGPKVDGTGVSGRVLLEDRFGNVITNIPRELVLEVGQEGRGVRVRVGPAFIRGLARTFSDVPKGDALAYIGSGDHLEVAVNGGRASELLGLGTGSPIRVEPDRT